MGLKLQFQYPSLMGLVEMGCRLAFSRHLSLCLKKFMNQKCRKYISILFTFLIITYNYIPFVYIVAVVDWLLSHQGLRNNEKRLPVSQPHFEPKLHENQYMKLTQTKNVNASESRIGFFSFWMTKWRKCFLGQSLSASVVKRSMADQMQTCSDPKGINTVLHKVIRARHRHKCCDYCM